MLDRLDAVGRDELEDLIRQSYEMVAAKAPKRGFRTKTRDRSKWHVRKKST
jgi:predicted DNA-binding protein (MmcQ/YjbR family)